MGLELQPPKGPSDLCPRLNGFYSTLTPACATSSTLAWTEPPRNTLAPPDSGSTSTAASATGPRSPTGRTARLMLTRPTTDSLVPRRLLLMSSASSTPTPSTLTLTTVLSSTSA